MYRHLTPIVNNARVRIRGVASQYEFEASLPADIGGKESRSHVDDLVYGPKR